MAEEDPASSSTPSMSPPTEYEPLEEARPRSSWPTTIGVISLIYAIGGLLCQVGSVGSTIATEWLMSLAGLEVTVPATVKLTAVIFGSVLLGLGVLLLAGAVQLLRRRRSSIKVLKTWVVLRLVVLIVGIVAAFFTMPSQVAMQMEIQEAQNNAMSEAGRGDQIQERSPDEIRQQIIRWMFIMNGVFAIYPLFLGFYLSRRKVRDEVDSWDAEGDRGLLPNE